MGGFCGLGFHNSHLSMDLLELGNAQSGQKHGDSVCVLARQELCFTRLVPMAKGSKMVHFWSIALNRSSDGFDHFQWYF